MSVSSTLFRSLGGLLRTEGVGAGGRWTKGLCPTIRYPLRLRRGGIDEIVTWGRAIEIEEMEFVVDVNTISSGWNISQRDPGRS